MIKKIEDDFILLSNNFIKKTTELYFQLFQRMTKSVSEKDFQKYSASLMSNDKTKYPLNSTYKITPKDEFVSSLFSDCNEVNTSMANLCFSMMLSKRLYNKVIPANELLHYYFKNFISEIYVFNQRVRKIFNKLDKLTKKLGLHKERNIIIECKTGFMNLFININKIRAKHIHERGYTDEKFIQLTMLKFYGNIESSHNEWLQKYFKYNLRNNKKYYSNNMKETLVAIEKLTNYYLEKITNVVFINIYNKL